MYALSARITANSACVANDLFFEQIEHNLLVGCVGGSISVNVVEFAIVNHQAMLEGRRFSFFNRPVTQPGTGGSDTKLTIDAPRLFANAARSTAIEVA